MNWISPMSLKKILILTILVHLLASFFSTGYYHADEHFQILEFAGLKLGLNQSQDMPWEYHYKMRPAIQPAIAYLMTKICYLFSIHNPFTITMFLRMLSAGLGVLCMSVLFLAYEKSITSSWLKKWLLLLSFFLWFLIYLQVRFSSETWSGALFFMGLGLYLLWEQKQKYNYFFRFIIGLILGFAFIIRFQTGFMITGFILWLVMMKREKITHLLSFVLGLICMFLIGILIDRWFYGVWTLTTWNYLDLNIIQNKVNAFGTQAWWYYIYQTFIQTIPPYSLLLILAFFGLIFFYPRHILTWSIFPLLVIHTLIGHKEIRFLFPLVNIIPVVIVLFLQKTIDDKNLLTEKFLKHFGFKLFYQSFWIINIILLIMVSLKPTNALMGFYQYVYNQNYKTLYYLDNNPYQSSGQMGTSSKNFYKRESLQLIKINSLEELKKQVSPFKEKIIFMDYHFNRDQELDRLGFPYKKVFQNLPEWSKYFNINNWLSRTKVVSIYEINPN